MDFCGREATPRQLLKAFLWAVLSLSIFVGCGGEGVPTEEVPPLAQTINVGGGLLLVRVPADWSVDDSQFAEQRLLTLHSVPADLESVPQGQHVYIQLRLAPTPPTDLRLFVAELLSDPDLEQIHIETRNGQPVAWYGGRALQPFGAETFAVSVYVFAAWMDGVQVTVSCLNYEDDTPQLFNAIVESIRVDAEFWQSS